MKLLSLPARLVNYVDWWSNKCWVNIWRKYADIKLSRRDAKIANLSCKLWNIAFSLWCKVTLPRSQLTLGREVNQQQFVFWVVKCSNSKIGENLFCFVLFFTTRQQTILALWGKKIRRERWLYKLELFHKFSFHLNISCVSLFCNTTRHWFQVFKDTDIMISQNKVKFIKAGAVWGHDTIQYLSLKKNITKKKKNSLNVKSSFF